MGLFGCGDRGGFAALLKLLEMYQNQRKGKYIMRLQSFSFKCVIRSSEGFWLRSFARGALALSAEPHWDKQRSRDFLFLCWDHWSTLHWEKQRKGQLKGEFTIWRRESKPLAP